MQSDTKRKPLSKEFDWEVYIQANPALSAFKTYSEARAHWLKIGIRRNLVATEYDFYRRNNLKVEDLPIDFDWKEYLSLNPDVSKKVKGKWEAIRHYLKYGVHGKRSYKDSSNSLRAASISSLTEGAIDPDFSLEIYTQLNPSLPAFPNRVAAYQHWLSVGKSAGMMATEEQLYSAYKASPSDLPTDFNWKQYLKLNPDVEARVNSKWGAIRHYLRYGISGGRPYKAAGTSVEVDIVNPANYKVRTDKLKVAVVAWDMGHNPAGRAYLLADMLHDEYDVDLMGPISPKYNNTIWGPLSNCSVRTLTFLSKDFDTFVEGCHALAQTQVYDFVYVSKPRFPSLLLDYSLKNSATVR